MSEQLHLSRELIPAGNRLDKPTVVLFFGGGQDSLALLYKYYYDPDFQRTYVGKSHFLVIMSDTGCEFPSTYLVIEEVKHWCKRVGIEFYFITATMGYHGRTWQSLQAQNERNSTVMGVGFNKSCTDQLKIQVCYRFLMDWLRVRYCFKAEGHKVFYEYKTYYGKLITWIGFAKGEESRIARPDKLQSEEQTSKKAISVAGTKFAKTQQNGHFLTDAEPMPMLELGMARPKLDIPKWRYLCVSHHYPLVELGLDRAGCQKTITQYGHKVPFPSHCFMCPFQSEPEIVYLFRVYPDKWAYWVEREAAKIAKSAHKTVNLGVKGKILLPQYLQKALEKYGDWSMEQLEEYRFSHGHCVMSSY